MPLVGEIILTFHLCRQAGRLPGEPGHSRLDPDHTDHLSGAVLGGLLPAEDLLSGLQVQGHHQHGGSLGGCRARHVSIAGQLTDRIRVPELRLSRHLILYVIIGHYNAIICH